MEALLSLTHYNDDHSAPEPHRFNIVHHIMYINLTGFGIFKHQVQFGATKTHTALLFQLQDFCHQQLGTFSTRIKKRSQAPGKSTQLLSI